MICKFAYVKINITNDLFLNNKISYKDYENILSKNSKNNDDYFELLKKKTISGFPYIVYFSKLNDNKSKHFFASSSELEFPNNKAVFEFLILIT